MELNISLNESSQETEFNLDSSHSAEDEKKLENENQLPESLRFFFELVDKDPEHPIAQCLLWWRRRQKTPSIRVSKTPCPTGRLICLVSTQRNVESRGKPKLKKLCEKGKRPRSFLSINLEKSSNNRKVAAEDN